MWTIRGAVVVNHKRTSIRVVVALKAKLHLDPPPIQKCLFVCVCVCVCVCAFACVFTAFLVLTFLVLLVHSAQQSKFAIC